MNVYLLVTHRADLINYQKRLFEKNVRDFNSITVANNGPLSIVIEEECRQLGLPFISLERPEAHLNPSWKTAWALQCLWDHHISGKVKNDVLFVDLDIFPIEPSCPSDWLDDAHIAAPVNVAGEARYPFPGLLAVRQDVCMSGDRLEFGCDTICGSHCDTGGALVRWLLARDRSTWRHLEQRQAVADDLPESIAASYEPDFGFGFLDSGRWLHTTKCTNWIGYPPEYIARKERVMFQYLDYLLGK